MDREELFYQYQVKIRHLEEDREEYERQRRMLEEDKEQARIEFGQDRSCIENIRNLWGDCEDSGRLSAEFEDSVEEEYREMERREEKLQQERRRFQKETSLCEEWYQEENMKILEEEES